MNKHSSGGFLKQVVVNLRLTGVYLDSTFSTKESKSLFPPNT